MNARIGRPLAAGCVLLLSASCGERRTAPAAVPIALDHDRMLVEAEVQRKDGGWRKARLWVDTGNPDFFMSEAFARDLGMDLQAATKGADGSATRLEVPPPTGVRIGGMPLDFQGVKSVVMFEPRWLLATMHADANLPATVLKRYHVIFDYPRLEFAIAAPGSLKPRGARAPASVHPETGIVQIDAVVAGENLSFALDNGASYSFTSNDVLERLSRGQPGWPRCIGAVGCANIWGWWPGEPEWPVVRVPEIRWGSVPLSGVGLVGLPNFFPGGAGLGEWYSRKTARPVDGILGPNAFKAFRVEIDYAGSAVYFEKGVEPEAHDMDLVGLTLRPEADGTYRVIGVASKHGERAVEGVEAGDELVQVDGLEAAGATMGTVVDALRGRPGDTRILLLERNGKRFTVEAKVERFL